MIKDYSDKDKLDWLKCINPNFKNEDWHNKNVYKPTDLRYYDFFEEHKKYDADINPNQIIGIEYAFNYNFHNNITWVELFLRLKRLDWVINKFKNVDELSKHIHLNYQSIYITMMKIS